MGVETSTFRTSQLIEINLMKLLNQSKNDHWWKTQIMTGGYYWTPNTTKKVGFQIQTLKFY